MRNLNGEYISAEQMAAIILTADTYEIDVLLGAVILQYKTLFPQWDVATFSIERNENRNAQLDNTIAMLENMKE